MQTFEEAVEEIFYYYDSEIRTVKEKCKEKRTVIFGAGELGHRVYNALKERGVSVACFCDNKTCGKADLRTGLNIMSLDELKDDIKKIFVLIAVFDDAAYASVYQQLLDFGLESEHLMNSKIIAERLPISYLEENKDRYKKAYSLLGDDFSKNVYLNRMKKAYFDKDISQIVSDAREEYFDANVLLTGEEVFVDCGGFDGDTALKFIKRTKGRFKKIIIFEPEEYKEILIKKRMKNYNFDFYRCGVWSKDTVLKFDARGDCGSCVSEEGEVEIEVKALDETIFEDAPTYIKMDIEGSEIEALKGCKKIIQQYKPKLAICIYHNPEDLFEIPIMIKEMCQEYRLTIRQYANSQFETVCYAI